MNVFRRGVALAATSALTVTLSVAVASAAVPQVNWTPVKTISDSGTNGFWPRVVSSSDGTRLTTVWRNETSTTQHHIGAASSADGGATWTPALELDDGGGQPSLVGSDDGLRVSAVWYSYANDKVRTASSSNGGQTWSTPADIRSSGAFNYSPFLSGSSDGNRLAAVWVDRISGQNVVQMAFSTNAGQTWSSPQNLSDTDEDAVDPHVAMSADGTRVTVVFSQKPTVGKQRIFASTSANGGSTWSAATPISVAGENASEPKVAMSADGSAVHVVYGGEDAGYSRIQATTSPDGVSNWSTSVPLSEAGQAASRPQVTASTNGTRLTAAWQRFDGSFDRIQSATSSDAGVNWTPVPVTHSAAGSDAYDPQIVGSDDGVNVTISWPREDPNSSYLIETASSDDGGGSWNSARLLSDNTQEAYDPAVATSADGRRVLAAWSQSDGTDFRIQSSIRLIQTAPGAPRAVTAAAGDGLLTASWTPPADDGNSAVTSYTATAAPGGGSCTSTTTSCTISGLANGTTYTVSVTATNAVGTGPASAPSNPVTPVAPVTPITPVTPTPDPDPAKPATTVIAKAKAGRSKLQVRIKPNLGAKKQWKFVVQVKRGGWKTLKTKKRKVKVYATKGSKHRLTINLDKGKYRAKSRAARGYRADTSKVIKLKK